MKILLLVMALVCFETGTYHIVETYPVLPMEGESFEEMLRRCKDGTKARTMIESWRDVYGPNLTIFCIEEK